MFIYQQKTQKNPAITTLEHSSQPRDFKVKQSLRQKIEIALSNIKKIISIFFSNNFFNVNFQSIGSSTLIKSNYYIFLSNIQIRLR